jgi:hypothetical protein
MVETISLTSTVASTGVNLKAPETDPLVVGLIQDTQKSSDIVDFENYRQ